jgi:hypothetical protein
MSLPDAFRVRFAALALLSAIAAACQSSDGVAPAAVARVAVTGVADTLAVGDRRTLVASVTDAHGAAIADRPVVWTATNPGVATVDSTGQLTAVAVGQTTVSATSGGVRGDVSITVKRQAVARVTVDREADTLWLTRSHLLRARLLGSNGAELSQRLMSWVSLDTTIAAITLVGSDAISIRGGRLGTTRIVARSENVDTAITVSVVPIPVARIVVSAPDTLYVGKRTTIHAQAWAPDGTALVNTDLAGRSVKWATDRAGPLTVQGITDEEARSFSGLSATLVGRSNGSVNVTATLDSAVGQASVTAARAPVAAVRFVPTAVAMRVGETLTLAASPIDADSVDLDGIPLNYAIVAGSDVLKLTQTTAGPLTVARLEALAIGSATVSVTAEGRTSTLPVTITSATRPIRVYPTTITAAPGARGRLTVIATDASGGTLSTGVVSFRSTNPAVVTVDTGGRVTMVGPGTAVVVASVGGASAATDVTVAARQTSPFHIEVRPVGTVPPEIMAAAVQAAARWERIIAAELPPTEVTLGPGECVPGVGAVHLVTTGLVVYLTAQQIDGPRKVLAYAGPCVTRDATQGGLPSVGTMTIDMDDVPLLTGSLGALAADVVAHELGHVLGIGTLWYGGSPAGSLVRDNGGDFRFDGPAAAAAAVRTGMVATAAEGVAVEDAGGGGTVGGHWRERVFLGELMTGYVGDAPNPLSVITVQSLRDLGYQVTETGADIVSPASIIGGAAFLALPAPGASAASRNAKPGPSFQIGERLLRPKFSVDRSGRRRAIPQDKQ